MHGAARSLISLLCCVLLGAAALSCGSDTGSSKLSECDQLQNSLCDRTTDCSISAGMTQSIDREVFHHRCLRALGEQLTCSVPSDGSGDFEVCSGAIDDIPCEVVIEYLGSNQVVAPASSCGEFFGL